MNSYPIFSGKPTLRVSITLVLVILSLSTSAQFDSIPCSDSIGIPTTLCDAELCPADSDVSCLSATFGSPWASDNSFFPTQFPASGFEASLAPQSCSPAAILQLSCSPTHSAINERLSLLSDTSLLHASPCPIGPLILSGGLFLASATIHYPPLTLNSFVRDNVQDWRNTSTLNGRALKFDNFLQLSPATSVLLIKAFGVHSRHNFLDLTLITAESYLFVFAFVNVVKYTTRIQRPDTSSFNAYPSGHTATAFVGAELLRTEYNEVSPWIGVAGYTLATLTGFMRIYNNRHWTADVIGGAGAGILSVCLANWVHPALRRWMQPHHNKAHLGTESPSFYQLTYYE